MLVSFFYVKNKIGGLSQGLPEYLNPLKTIDNEIGRFHR